MADEAKTRPPRLSGASTVACAALVLAVLALAWAALNQGQLNSTHYEIMVVKALSAGLTEDEVRACLGEPNSVGAGSNLYVGERGAKTLRYHSGGKITRGGDIWVVLDEEGRVISVIWPDIHHRSIPRCAR